MEDLLSDSAIRKLHDAGFTGCPVCKQTSYKLGYTFLPKVDNGLGVDISKGRIVVEVCCTHCHFISLVDALGIGFIQYSEILEAKSVIDLKNEEHRRNTEQITEVLEHHKPQEAGG